MAHVYMYRGSVLARYSRNFIRTSARACTAPSHTHILIYIYIYRERERDIEYASWQFFGCGYRCLWNKHTPFVIAETALQPLTWWFWMMMCFPSVFFSGGILFSQTPVWMPLIGLHRDSKYACKHPKSESGVEIMCVCVWHSELHK